MYESIYCSYILEFNNRKGVVVATKEASENKEQEFRKAWSTLYNTIQNSIECGSWLTQYMNTLDPDKEEKKMEKYSGKQRTI